MNWVPATLHLNASQLPTVSTDYIALFDINTRKHKRVELQGLPPAANGIWVHAIEVYRSPSSPSNLTLFVNSHRPPADRSLAPTQGADSVVEIFETEVGSNSARWVKTVRHPLVRTPNSVAAVNERQFYVSNDHRHKVHWTRKWEVLKSVPSDIIFCDASGPGDAQCMVAADQVVYPNGKSPLLLLRRWRTVGLTRRPCTLTQDSPAGRTVSSTRRRPSKASCASGRRNRTTRSLPSRKFTCVVLSVPSRTLCSADLPKPPPAPTRANADQPPL